MVVHNWTIHKHPVNGALVGAGSLWQLGSKEGVASVYLASTRAYEWELNNGKVYSIHNKPDPLYFTIWVATMTSWDLLGELVLFSFATNALLGSILSCNQSGNHP
jgi:hypothetical protein